MFPKHTLLQFCTEAETDEKCHPSMRTGPSNQGATMFEINGAGTAWPVIVSALVLLSLSGLGFVRGRLSTWLASGGSARGAWSALRSASPALGGMGVAIPTALADDPAPPDLATRVADLEAYVTNGAPKALISSGPGHNGWMMTCAALVLFMTLPGLALFYGGLVRRKNVLSVLAQCCG